MESSTVVEVLCTNTQLVCVQYSMQYLVFVQQSSDGVLVCEVTAQKAEPGSPVSRPSDSPSGAVKLSAHRSPQEACCPGNQDAWRPHQQLLLST